MSSFLKVIEAPFSINPQGLKVLQCHSRGDRRFSPLCCFVEAFGQTDSIENHYQRAKVFEGNLVPHNWRDAKRWKKSGLKQVGWQIGSLRLPCVSNEQRNGFALNDFGIQFYIALWQYLLSNKTLLTIASHFDEFEDPFKSTFPFCQADVIRQCVREGIDSLRPMYDELRSLLIQQPLDGTSQTSLQPTLRFHKDQIEITAFSSRTPQEKHLRLSSNNRVEACQKPHASTRTGI